MAELTQLLMTRMSHSHHFARERLTHAEPAGSGTPACTPNSGTRLSSTSLLTGMDETVRMTAAAERRTRRENITAQDKKSAKQLRNVADVGRWDES